MGVWDSHDSNVRGEREVAQTGKRKYVCVTGSWSLVGSWLVRTLLEKGYNVRSTLRTSTGKSSIHYSSFQPLGACLEARKYITPRLLGESLLGYQCLGGLASAKLFSFFFFFFQK